MTISIVLAVYNGSRFLSQQLDSLRSQATGADEVIISDDCSSDDSCSLIEEYIKTNSLSGWRLLKNETNLGYIGNFRRALAAASGDIIFLSDQDDVWLPEKVETVSDIFLKRPDISAVCGSYTTIDDKGNITESAASAGSGKITISRLLRGNPSPGCTCAYRRPVVEDYLSIPESAVPHDWALNLISAREGGLYMLNTPLTLYRQHSGNLIGLKGHGRGLKMTTPADKRLSILREQEALADSFCSLSGLGGADKRLVKHFKKYCQNRRRALDSFSLNAAFCNFYEFIFVKNINTVSARGLAGDLIWVLRGCKKGKE